MSIYCPSLQTNAFEMEGRINSDPSYEVMLHKVFSIYYSWSSHNMNNL